VRPPSAIVPYTLVNYYNKWLYLCGFTREWILGRHYASWTGRQGRKTVITPMTWRRRVGLTQIGVGLAAGTALYGWLAGSSQLLEGAVAAALAIPALLLPHRPTGKRRAPRVPEPAVEATPVVGLPDEDTVQIPRVPVVKLLDPETETTLTLPIPRQRTAAPQPEGTRR
jgi:hypothetical protein